MDRDYNIVLIGFMGCGKSSVGVKLAGAIDYNFIDTDTLIENDYGMSISNIFNEKGEEAFRELETALLRRIVKSAKKTVIATGGGMPLRKENTELLKKAGYVILLRTSTKTTLLRLSGDTQRPLLAGDNPEEKVNMLMEERLPIYEAAADYIVDADNRSFFEIIKDIENYLSSKQ